MRRPLGKQAITRQRDAEAFLAVIQELYASAMQGTSEIWSTIYEQSAQLVGSEAGGFFSTDKVNQAADLARLVGFNQEDAVRAYREYGVEVDVIFMEAQSMPAGSTFLGTEKFGLHGLQRSPFYDILSAPLGLRFLCAGILENDDHHLSALCFWRRANQPDFDRSAMLTLTNLMPHVRQVLEVQRRIRGPELNGTPVGALTLAAFQNSRHGILVLDEKGRVLFANLEAERIARSGNGLAIRNGVLSPDDAGMAAEVERMMSRALGIARDTEVARMLPVRIPQKTGGQHYELLMIPVTDGAQRALLPPSAAFILTVTDPGAVAAVSHQRLRAYGLTGAEVRMCEALIRTGSLLDAAEQLHISRSTARSHLKTVFEKLGVTSQVQLVMRLSGAPVLPGTR